MENNSGNEIEKQCKALLGEFYRKVTAQEIIKVCRKEIPDNYKGKSDKSYEGYISNIRNGLFDSGIATKEFRDILLKIKKDHDKAYDTTVIWHYWSEGVEDNIDIDNLRIAFISLNFEDLNNTKDAECVLIYKGKTPKAGIFRKLSKENIVSFQFKNGTAILMYINSLNKVRHKYFKGTYIATPYGNIVSGIGLFEVRREKVAEVMNRDLNQRGLQEQERIITELYKQRLLVPDNSIFGNISELRTNDFYNDLADIKASYIRYRKSDTDGKLYGDLITIESFGRVIYNGVSSISVHGRCFIQKDVEFTKAKNLIIELYQEDDTDQKGFEFRHPHSFMMFDIRETTLVISGYSLRPRSGYFVYSGKCLLIKVIDASFNSSKFDHQNFEHLSPESLYDSVKSYHALQDSPNNELIKEAFCQLFNE